MAHPQPETYVPRRELEAMRGAADHALAIGYRLQARIETALAVVEELPSGVTRELLLAALRGGETS